MSSPMIALCILIALILIIGYRRLSMRNGSLLIGAWLLGVVVTMSWGNGIWLLAVYPRCDKCW